VNVFSVLDALIQIIDNFAENKKMVKAWYINTSRDDIDKQSELHMDPPEFIEIKELPKKTGVLYWKINVDHLKEEGLFDKIRLERGYNYEDLIEISRDKLPNYDNTINKFYQEHFHADEEIRFVLEGSGYFDVRDVNDRWIRILVQRGDLIILPTGIHHRFTLDSLNYIKVMRLFIGEPIWTAHPRPDEEHEARKKYIEQVSKGFCEVIAN